MRHYFAKSFRGRLISLFGFIALMCQPVSAGSDTRKVINIEAAMRAWQERVMMVSPFPASYPDNRSGHQAPPYPEDGFYGSDLLDPTFAASLVDDLYWAMYWDVREFVEAPAQNPVRFEVPPYVAIDESNYVTIFKQLVDLIHACKIARGNFSMVEPWVVTTKVSGQGWGATRSGAEADAGAKLSNAAASTATFPGALGAPSSVNSWEALWQQVAYDAFLVGGDPNKKWEAEARASQRTITTSTPRMTGTGEAYVWAHTIFTQRHWSTVMSSTSSTEFSLWTTFPLGGTTEIGTIGFAADDPDPQDFSDLSFSAMEPLTGSSYYSTKKISYAVLLFLKTNPTRRVDQLMVEVSCPCERCAAGETKARNECVKVTMSLGTGKRGAAGELYIDEATPSDLLSSPRLLRLRSNGDAITTYFNDASGQPYIRQIVSPQALVDIVIEDSHSYRVDFYKREFQGTLQPDGTYATTGSAYRSVSIKNPDNAIPLTKVRVTVSTGSNILTQSDYEWDTASSGWTMSETGGAEVRSVSRTSVASANPGERIETVIQKDADQNIISKRVLTFRVFPWNVGSNAVNSEELIQEVIDPDGDALTTTYEFYESTDFATGAQASRIRLITEPSGFWTKYEYYDDGATERVVTPWGNAHHTESDKVRYRLVQRSPFNPDYTLIEEGLSRIVDGSSIKQILKAEHRYVEQLWADPYGSVNQLYVEHDTTGETADRIATITSFYNNFYMAGFAAGKPYREVNPDGSGRVYVYRNTAEGFETTTYEGQLTSAYASWLMPTFPDPTSMIDASSIIDAGTKRVTVTSDSGETLIERVYAVPSGILLSYSEAVELDYLGRVTRREYLDGTNEQFHYACCGLDYSIDREGIRTDYHYNGFRELEGSSRAGVRFKQHEEFISGLLNRVTTRFGSVDTASAEVVEQRREVVNLAGRTLSVRDFDLRTTHFSEELLPSGETVRTITNPDGGTIVETYRLDGALYTVTGSAAAHEKHEEDFDAEGYFRRVIRVGDGGAETEWVKTYYDFLGRPVKIVYPDSSYSETEYHPLSLGARIIRQRDPDGVTILKEYLQATATEPEQEIVAVNMSDASAAEPTIDLGGTDRVTRTTREVATRTDGSTLTTVQRVTTEVWLTNNEDTPRELTVTDISFDGLTSWQKTNGLTTKRVTVIDAATKTRTETTTFPDETSLVRVAVNGRLQSEIRKDNTNTTVTSFTYGYDAHGRPETVTDSLGRVTTTTYHADDQIHTVTTPDPDTAKSGTGYDAQTTTYTYDEAGRVWKVEQHDGALTETTYWGNGKVKRISGGRIYPQAYTYDAQGRVKTLTTWQDFAGESGAAVTTWHYHAERGWLESKEYNDGKGPSYTYTPAGRLETRTWARTVGGSPLVTTYGYNNAGELNSITYNDDTTAHPTPPVTHTYDRGGRLLTTTDAAGLLTRSYDPASLRLSGEAYTGTGELSGRSIARTYDLLHRPQSLATDGGYGLGYGYDKAGRLETLNQGFHSATFGYEAGTSIHNRTIVKRVGVERVRHDRDLDRIGRIASVTSTVGGTAVVARTYTYNDANQRTGVEVEDGRHWAYGYDPLGQVTFAQKRLADNTTPLPGYSFGYTFDDIGNRTQTVTNGRTALYNADLLNRYEDRVVPGAFDVRGEAHDDTTVTVDALATTRTGKDFYRELIAANGSTAVNQAILVEASRITPPESADETRFAFLPKSPESFEHDDDGNLRLDGRWEYHWDAENRLVKMETRASIATAFPDLKKRITFRYDAQGRRIRKTVESWDTGTSDWLEALDLRFLYDGWNLLTELDANNGNALVRAHAWGLDLSGSTQGAGGVGGLLWTSTPTHSFSPCFDGNGNPTAWINTGTLAVSGRADFGAFGEIVTQTGVAKVLPFGFSTKYRDEESGLLYYGYRYLDTSTGRWLGRDPLAEKGGLNLFGAVTNNPIGRWDLLGLLPDSNDPYGSLVDATEGDLAAAYGFYEEYRKSRIEQASSVGIVVAIAVTAKYEDALRRSYNAADKKLVEQIRGLVKEGLVSEAEGARMRVEMRNKLALQIRDRSSAYGRTLAEFMKPGTSMKTYEQLRASNTDADILAKTPNAGVNRANLLVKRGANCLIVVGVVVAGAEVYIAPPGEKYTEAIGQLGGFAGAMAAGWAGAKAGEKAGKPFGPYGPPIGAFVVGIPSAIIGGIVADQVARDLFDLIIE